MLQTLPMVSQDLIRVAALAAADLDTHNSGSDIRSKFVSLSLPKLLAKELDAHRNNPDFAYIFGHPLHLYKKAQTSDTTLREGIPVPTDPEEINSQLKKLCYLLSSHPGPSKEESAHLRDFCWGFMLNSLGYNSRQN